MSDYTPQHAATDEVKPLLSDNTYDKVKASAALVFPALIAFWMTISTIWNLPYQNEVGGTLGALNIFLGVLLLVASKLYNKQGVGLNGTVEVTKVDGQPTAVVFDIKTKPEDLINQKQVNLVVNNPS